MGWKNSPITMILMWGRVRGGKPIMVSRLLRNLWIVRRSRGLGGSGLLGARLLTLATAAATAAAVLGRDGVGVDQLEHLTVSHVFSLSFGPTGHFSEPYPV